MHVPYSFCVVILGQLCGVGSMEWNSGPQTSEANNCLYPVRYLADHHHNSPMGPTLENKRTNYHKFSSGFHVAHLCEYTHTIKEFAKKNHPFDKHHISVPWKRYTVLYGLQ